MTDYFHKRETTEVGANAIKPVELDGLAHYFNIYSQDGADDVLVSFDGAEPFTVEANVGQFIPQGFERIKFFNPNAAEVYVEWAATNGEIKDRRLNLSGSITSTISNTVSVKSAAADFTDADTADIADAAAVLILAANANRTGAVIDAGGKDLWIGPDNTVAAGAVPSIRAGTAKTITHKGDVWAIRAAGDSGAARVYEEASA